MWGFEREHAELRVESVIPDRMHQPISLVVFWKRNQVLQRLQRARQGMSGESSAFQGLQTSRTQLPAAFCCGGG